MWLSLRLSLFVCLSIYLQPSSHLHLFLSIILFGRLQQTSYFSVPLSSLLPPPLTSPFHSSPFPSRLFHSISFHSLDTLVCAFYTMCTKHVWAEHGSSHFSRSIERDADRHQPAEPECLLGTTPMRYSLRSAKVSPRRAAVLDFAAAESIWVSMGMRQPSSSNAALASAAPRTIALYLASPLEVATVAGLSILPFELQHTGYSNKPPASAYLHRAPHSFHVYTEKCHGSRTSWLCGLVLELGV